MAWCIVGSRTGPFLFFLAFLYLFSFSPHYLKDTAINILEGQFIFGIQAGKDSIDREIGDRSSSVCDHFFFMSMRPVM